MASDGTYEDAEEANADWKSAQDLDYKFAARLIKDAKESRNITFKKSIRSLNSYEIFLSRKCIWTLNLAILVQLLLPFIEKPTIYTEIPHWVPCLIELLCLIVFTIRWIHLRTIQTAESFNSDKKNFVVIFTIVAILIDIVMYVLAHELGFQFIHRYTRPLRVLIYINFNEGKELRRAFRNVRKTLPDILNVFALFFVSILIFGFLAWQLFKGKNELVYSNNQTYFKNYEDSIWDLYISVTTANFPDVMMPAYDLNGVYSLFFIAFMLINFYIFINIILATIYTNYKRHLKEEVALTLKIKRDKLNDSFKLLNTTIHELFEKQRKMRNSAATSTTTTTTTSKYAVVEFKETELVKNQFENVINYEDFQRLMKIIQPDIHDSQIEIFFRILDTDNNSLLTFKEYSNLADLLNLRVSETKDRLNTFQRFIPKLYDSKISRILRYIVGLRAYQYFFDFLILLNILFVIIYSNKNRFEWFFLVAFLIEILLKIYTLGLKKFASIYWNIFDTIIIVSGLVAGIVEAFAASGDQDAATADGGGKRSSTELFEVILILRSLRLLKFVASIKRFRVIITTIAIITPSLLTYGMLIITIYYVFSMVGMELFGDVVKTQTYTKGEVYDCQNRYLNETDFTRFRYCKNNFASFHNSLIFLFELMVVNQWHILSRGFEDALNSNKFTRLFFLAFHLTCVIVLLNIFTAFVIEAFLLEYETEGSKSSNSVSSIERRIIDMGLNHNQQQEQTTMKNDNNENIMRKSFVSRFVDELRDIFTNSKSLDSNNKANNKTDDQENNLRFHLNPKEPKSVEILLQRMFLDEL